MLFNSFEFLIFFLTVTTLFFVLPHKWRWLLLLVASCYFYMYFIPVYILILFGTIIIDYVAGIMIENEEGKKRKLFLTISIIANIGVLAVFKYYNFFADNLNQLFTASGSNFNLKLLSIMLPIGLSFHTFQAMSYTIEVYRGNQKAERHFGIYALYVMFYPQLVAGPIERPQNVLHQFHERKQFNWENVFTGLKLILWGLFKKIVIADRLALTSNEVFNNVTRYNGYGPAYFIAIIFFTFQIYCDFSGYSDIALGSARVMGYNLMENFKRPYLSKTIAEFWTRWHISLSTWFRDYLYIPLGGNRVTISRNYINLSIVFLVSGLWHGAAWTFVIWGALHAIYLVIGRITAKSRNNLMDAIGISKHPFLSRALSVFTTFLLVSFAWIFFRANSLADAWHIINQLGSGWQSAFSVSYIQHLAFMLGGNNTIVGLVNLCAGIAGIMFMELVQLNTTTKSAAFFADNKRPILQWGYYYTLILAILLIGVFESQEFIYFQF